MTALTVAFNVVLIPAFGTVASSTLVSTYGMWRLLRSESAIHFERGMDLRPDFAIIRSNSAAPISCPHCRSPGLE